MQHYQVFGGCLRSELAFPELRTAPHTLPNWTLRVSDLPILPAAAELLGEDELIPGARVRLFRINTGFRMEFDDTGRFEVTAGGAEIVWCPAPDAQEWIARSDVIGRVLSLAQHARGLLCLHGSGVAVGDGAIAFVAPKGHGKSTLASAMLAAGSRLVTDDTLPVEITRPPMAYPGVHTVRLWGDSKVRLLGDAPRRGDAYNEKYTVNEQVLEKHVVTDLADDQLMPDPLPLAAVYELAPKTDGPPARRERMPGAAAAMALLRHSRLGLLLGKHEASVLFDRALALAQRVPVYRLEVLRDFDRLGDVVAELFDWHGVTPALGAAERALG